MLIIHCSVYFDKKQWWLFLVVSFIWIKRITLFYLDNMSAHGGIKIIIKLYSYKQNGTIGFN